MRPFSAREEFSREAFNKIKTKKKKKKKKKKNNETNESTQCIQRTKNDYEHCVNPCDCSSECDQLVKILS